MSAQHPNGVRLIGAMKLLTALLLILGSIGAFHLMDRNVSETAKKLLWILHLDLKNSYLNSFLISITDLTPNDLRKIGFATFIYAILYIIEGIGLLHTKRWAEYMTIIITSSLLPFEGYEVYLKMTPIRIGALVINSIIVIYLFYILRKGWKH